MERIAKQYRYPVTPACDPGAVVQGADYRFTVLTPCLIRAEYNAEGCFEDRATQVVVNRSFAVPAFTAEYKGHTLHIKTDAIELCYEGGPFTASSLMIRSSAFSQDWHWGDQTPVLPGTARTLDEVNGACPLQPSILSACSVAVMDDSASLILADDGWVEPRAAGSTDAYLFCHRHQYLQGLKDYCDLTGHIPLLPRYAFGNWWSRFHPYTQEEYVQLMERFREENIPFSVAVIDMDWHLVKIDRKYGTGWTGFTWNTELFPDHEALLQQLHEEGMEVTLNLHPAEGFSAHETCYPEMARRMGIDPATQQNIPFDVTNPDLLTHYFNAVLHPMEQEGVYFWWMDWQQGSVTSIPGLDPLWMVNHYHFMDMKNSGRRPMIFSRYAGHGSQRYPIGFSGDTIVTWDSLRFQPYFTAMASNVDYCWWSHDIGGHMRGIRDDELTARWVQYGVFSPINRLHSSCSPFLSKEPWRFCRDTAASMTRFLRLRHRLVPYLYTMNERTARTCVPLVCPLYFFDPTNPDAYERPNEYYFGTELLVSPITAPADAVTHMGCVHTLLPEGTWIDVFSGMVYDGHRGVINYRTLDEMPVFAKAGAIVPLAVPDTWNSIENPNQLEVQVFPGADGSFILYEDDGRTNAYEQGACVRTAFTWHWQGESELTISAPQGDTSLIPKGRHYTIIFRATEAEQVTANIPCTVTRSGRDIHVRLDSTCDSIVLHLKGCRIAPNPVKERVFSILDTACWDYAKKEQAWKWIDSDLPLTAILSTLEDMDMPEHLRRAMIEVMIARTESLSYRH